MYERYKKYKIAKTLKKYLDTRNKLKRLGIIRSEGSVVGDYAEWYVAEWFGLKLADSMVTAGYDAIDDRGKTYQIKARLVDSPNDRTAFVFKKTDNFDYFVPVLISRKTYMPLIEPIKIPSDYVETHSKKNNHDTRLYWTAKLYADIKTTVDYNPGQGEL
jgi:hypothetical protein